jgi:ABC-type uncharacterized transport system ATPase subunit
MYVDKSKGCTTVACFSKATATKWLKIMTISDQQKTKATFVSYSVKTSNHSKQILDNFMRKKQILAFQCQEKSLLFS